MRNLLKVAIGAIIIALLGYGLSLSGYMRLVWVGAIVLFGVEMTAPAVVFAILGGLLTDLLMHNYAGVTGLCVLVGLCLFLVARSAGLAVKEWQKLIVVVIAMTVCFAVDAVIRMLLGGSDVSFELLGFWSSGILLNSLLAVVGIFLLTSYERSSGGGKRVTL